MVGIPFSQFLFGLPTTKGKWLKPPLRLPCLRARCPKRPNRAQPPAPPCPSAPGLCSGAGSPAPPPAPPARPPGRQTLKRGFGFGQNWICRRKMSGEHLLTPPNKLRFFFCFLVRSSVSEAGAALRSQAKSLTFSGLNGDYH